MKALPPEVLAELQKEYLDSFSVTIPEIREALKNSDWPTVEKHFHRFAGSGATYGLPEISKMAKTLEMYIQNTPSPSGQHLEKAVELFEKVIINLKLPNDRG